MNQAELRSKLIDSLNTQGFHLNGNLTPNFLTKEHFKTIQGFACKEQILLQKDFLIKHAEIAKQFSIPGSEINPKEITLELRLVKENSIEEILFRWWNLMWWSVPYQKAYGRQMRFLIWDTTHNLPFGLIGLQSPVLKMSVRDNYLNIPKEDLDYVINKSMQAQRLGALPPYNQMLGGKMAALSLTSNELRNEYRKKYKGVKTVIKKRIIEPQLLFITTTSAFGKSSIYNRLKYKDEIVAKSLGYTKGAGTFHIPQELYLTIQKFLNRKNIDTNTTFGYGPSRKVKLLDKALSLLDLKEYHYHNIQREFYLFPIAKNLGNVLTKGVRPIYFQRSMDDLTDYWKSRWALKRTTNNQEWKKYTFESFLKAANKNFE